MHSLFSLKALAAGLAIGTSALAQAPPPGVSSPLPPQDPAVRGNALSLSGRAVSESSRIRAFNPGPGGQVDSLYLSNGSVVDLSPDLSRQVGSAIAKGERIRVSGLRSKVNGQTLVAANSITLHGQTFVAQPNAGPAASLDRLPPPPPPGGPNPGPGDRRGPNMARLGPNGPGPNGPRPDGPGRNGPPPSPNGPRPRPDGGQQAPPNGDQPPAQPASISPGAPRTPGASGAPAQPGAPMAPPPTQLATPSAQTPQNGPAL